MDAFEFMGAESCAQRYMFLARLKSLFPDMTCCVHDDACHLRRFADARGGCSDLAASLAYPNMRYILDRHSWQMLRHGHLRLCCDIL